jgi:prophage regulatory protein
MRILRQPEVLEKTGLRKPTLDRKERAGEFPKRVPLGTGRAVGWLDHEVEQWIKDRVRDRDITDMADGE